LVPRRQKGISFVQKSSHCKDTRIRQEGPFSPQRGEGNVLLGEKEREGVKRNKRSWSPRNTTIRKNTEQRREKACGSIVGTQRIISVKALQMVKEVGYRLERKADSMVSGQVVVTKGWASP